MYFKKNLIKFSIIFLLSFLSILSILRGWFPSEKILNRYPISVQFSFLEKGEINQFFVIEGDRVYNGDKLCEMYNLEFEGLKNQFSKNNKNIKMSKKALSNAINNGATIKFIRRLEDRIKVLEIENISLEDKIEILNDKFLIKLNHEFGGKVKKIFKKNGDQIQKNETILIVSLYQSYYSTFKVLSFIFVFSMIGFFYFLKKI
tara:strand:+ start:42 stop:650 length:609 start_codon:yes stop_codon:yes gene_type:complete